MCFMERATLTTAAVEEWRPVKEFDGLYEVSNLGRVRSLDRWIELPCVRWGGTMKRFMRSCIRKPKKCKDGYERVILSKNHEEKTYLVHRLVAEAFIQNTENLPCINHRDENKSNNCVYNLEWCSASYNLKYGTRPIKFGKSRGKPIEQMTLDGQVVARYYNEYEAVRQSNGEFTVSCINNVVLGKKKSYKGYRWRYVDN